MARTPLPEDRAETGAKAIEEAYTEGWSELNRAIRRGEPWSGNERNGAFLSVTDEKGALDFVDAAPLIGLDHADDGRSAARIDVDFDGDDDLVVTARTRPRIRVLRNDLANGTRHIAVRVVGAGMNPDGIGAHVFATPADSSPAPDGMTFFPGATAVRTRTAGSGYLSQSSPWLRFGFGRPAEGERRAPRVRLHVRWPRTTAHPAGLLEDFGEVRMDGAYVLTHGTGSAVEFKFPVQLGLEAGSLEDAPWLDEGRLALPRAASAPSLLVRATNGRVGPVFGVGPNGPQGTGLPAALFIFESDDPAAIKAIGDLAGLGQKCQELKITHFAVDLVKAVDEGAVDPLIVAKTRLSAAGWPGRVVNGVAETRTILSEFLAWRTGAVTPPPLPWLFILDPKGRVSTIRFGPWQDGDLVEDLTLITVKSAQRAELAAPFGGRILDPIEAVNLGELQNRLEAAGAPGAARELGLARLQVSPLLPIDVELRLGRSFLSQGDMTKAVDAFDRAVALDPANVLAHQGRGYALQLAGRVPEALESWTRAVALDGENVTSRTNRGLTAAALGRLALAKEDLGVLEILGERGVKGAEAVRNALASSPKDKAEEGPSAGGTPEDGPSQPQQRGPTGGG